MADDGEGKERNDGWKKRDLSLSMYANQITGAPVEEKQVERCIELMLILKWGGDLTKLGERQAERLGERFTQAMYPDPR